MPDAADLRRLAEHASRGGADAAWLERLMVAIVEQQLCVNQRQVEALSLKRQVRAADRQLRRAGVTAGRVQALCQRFGRSRATIARMLATEDD